MKSIHACCDYVAGFARYFFCPPIFLNILRCFDIFFLFKKKLNSHPELQLVKVTIHDVVEVSHALTSQSHIHTFEARTNLNQTIEEL